MESVAQGTCAHNSVRVSALSYPRTKCVAHGGHVSDVTLYRPWFALFFRAHQSRQRRDPHALHSHRARKSLRSPKKLHQTATSNYPLTISHNTKSSYPPIHAHEQTFLPQSFGGIKKGRTFALAKRNKAHT